MARGRKSQLVLTLSAEQRYELESWQRSTTLGAGLARRGRIILLLADGQSVSDVARQVAMGRRHIYKWVERFKAQGLRGLYDKPGRGRKPDFSPRSRPVSGRSGLSTT